MTSTAQPASGRSIRRILSLLLLGIRNSPAIARRSVRAVFSAEDAQARVAPLEAAMREMRGRMEAAEDQARVLGTRIDELRADMVARFDSVAGQIGGLKAQGQSFDVIISDLVVQTSELFTRTSGLSEQLAMVERESLFHQRQLTRLTEPAAPIWSIEGPFDSSYSLAVVNRNLARALGRAGETVALVSRDGPGPYPPAAAFLHANPDLAEMAARARTAVPPQVCLRNQFPPDVSDMRGTLLVLANYAWEESGFPAEWVRQLNASLNLITVTSSYVARILRDNGVDIPIAVVGNGVDPIFAGGGLHPVAERAGRAFRFVHLSSGFPRKGIDILLRVWGETFVGSDSAELIVKTFPNVHNQVETELRDFHARFPNAAPVTLINQDLSPAALRELYLSADALVFPSRGEGFGLPVAEAMALGKPVIVTAYGGQTDFCNSDTAWLCDYSFDYARTHLNVPDSIWVEPNVADLSRVVREVFETSADARLQRAAAGRDLVLSRHTWDHVATRTQVAVAAVQQAPLDDFRLPRIALISTWNSRCGIAAYAQSLACAIQPERLTVFASKVTEVLRQDESFVRRCWIQGWQDPLDELEQEVASASFDAVIIQFNFGFFALPALRRLLDRLHERGVLVFMIMHATTDVVRSDLIARLAELQPALGRVCRMLVHSVHDLNRLKAVGAVNNTALFPMGMPDPFSGNRVAVRRMLGLEDRKVVASFGYLLPHKGLRELIQAFALLREVVPNVHLLMVNALYPVPDSDEEHRACQQEIRRLGIEDDVTIMTAFLNEREVIARLASADVIVFPYQQTQESASAAVKMGIASLTPVAVTPLPIFADIATVSHTLPGISPAEIARGVEELFVDKAHLSDLANRQRAWADLHSWALLSTRLDNLIRGELRAWQGAVAPVAQEAAAG
jgi:glycosyltransferase involved in cell wall biosynthesis